MENSSVLDTGMIRSVRLDKEKIANDELQLLNVKITNVYIANVNEDGFEIIHI